MNTSLNKLSALYAQVPKIKDNIKSTFISSLLHFFVLYIFLYYFNSYNLPQRWETQFTILLGFSFCLTIVPIFFTKKSIISVSIGLRVGLLIIMGYPLADHLLIETILLFTIVYDLYMLLPLSFSIFFSALVSIIFFQTQRIHYTWGEIQVSPSINKILIVLVIFIGVNGFLITLKRQKILRQRAEKSLGHYKNVVQNLIDANLNLQENIINEIASAEEKENKRISQEIHDIVGHSMVNIMMLTESIKDKIMAFDEKTRSLLSLTRSQAESVLRDTGSVLHALKEVDYSRKYDIIAIKRMADIFQKATGIKIQLEFRNTPFSFGSEKDKIVYRIIQECFTNSFRHGKATKITVLFWHYEDTIELIIYDNGRGAKNIEEGIGIWGIRERVELIQGSINISNTPNGFEVNILFPYI